MWANHMNLYFGFSVTKECNLKDITLIVKAVELISNCYVVHVLFSKLGTKFSSFLIFCNNTGRD